MNKPNNPKTVHKPLGAYTHTIEVSPNARWLVLAGQVGINRQGKLAEGARRQTEQTFRNILACLRANRMSKDDLVKFTIYLTDSRHIEDYRTARMRVLGESAKPTATLVIVDGLALPDMLVEIEAWAAKA